jgi:sec-independent protein translocase protein TatB
MLDIGWTELLLIGIVALIVVGPKDLPHLFHALGRITARARSMAREFSSAMEDAAKGSGLDEAAGSLRDMKNLTSKKSLGLDALDRATERFEKWDPKLPTPRKAAQRDPAAPRAGAPAAAPARTPGSAATPASAGPSMAAAPAPGAQAPASAPEGQRRLKAVRRTDMKDD